jgi:2-(1,2-epoxy-1,2-dihydrophenyl)acetyl-CoA isomerase
MSGEVNDCLDIEATHYVHCMFIADRREAAAAFVESGCQFSSAREER